MADAGPSIGNATGAVLVAVGLIGGVLVATSVAGGSYGTAAVADDTESAYAIQLDDERVRLSFEPEEAAVPQPATVAVYRPDDTFHTQLTLTSEDPEATIDPEVRGIWILVVAGTEQARVTIGIEDVEDADATRRARQLPLTERHIQIASQEGGPLEANERITLHHRPAIAHLAYEGRAVDLDAWVATHTGMVHRIQNATGHATLSEPPGAGGRLNPGNLAVGAYTVNASAAAFEGRLVLVHRTYDRSSLDPEPTRTLDREGDPTEHGPLVAELQPEQPALVDTASTAALLFGVPEGSTARIQVYNVSDDIVGVIDVGEPREEPFDWDGEAANRSWTNALLTLPHPGSYVLYVAELHGPADNVTTVLPGASHASPARPLELERTTVTFQHTAATGEPRERQTHVSGGLVEVRLETDDIVTAQRYVQVVGPGGSVFEHHASASTAAGPTGAESVTHEERFSDGEFQVQAEVRSAVGTTRVHLLSYAR